MLWPLSIYQITQIRRKTKLRKSITYSGRIPVYKYQYTNSITLAPDLTG